MKKFRRLLLIIIVVVIAFFGASFIREITKDYANITEVDYRAVVVDDEGKVIITERLTYDIHAASENNVFWELWRDLPEMYVDGVKVDYQVNSVKEINEDGSYTEYGESPKLYWFDFDYIDVEGGLGPDKWFHSKGPYDGYFNYECVLFYVDGLYRETVQFEIEYEMTNAALRYGDASELYLAIFSGESVHHLTHFKGEILFPIEIMPSAGNYDAYTYGTNAHEFDFIESTTLNSGYHTFSFELDESELKFRPYNEYIEFALIAHGDDKHIFTQNASQNNYTDENMLPNIQSAQDAYENLPIEAHKNKMTLVSITSMLTLVGLLGAWFINHYIKKRYKMYQSDLSIDYFRDIPSELDANLARKLVFSKHADKDDLGDGYAAAMLSLTYKGYVTLVKFDERKDWSNANTCIQLKELTEGMPTLTQVESIYYELIKRHVNVNPITLKSFQDKVSNDYEYTTKFVSRVKKELNQSAVKENYFQNLKYKAPRKMMRGWAIFFIIIGISNMIIGNLVIYNTRLDLGYGAFFILGGGLILFGIGMIVISRKYILLTQFGEDEYVKWYALYNFLNSETLMKERTVVDLVIWEQYLIYATAFGISDKVIKALKVRAPEAFIQSSPILYHSSFRSHNFYRTSSRSFTTATRSATFRSSSGGHGGYGGGGRGGGGGGGGH